MIARPSIVMGESGSGWTPAFNVLYWPIRAFSRGLFEEVPARPEALVDVVPVDYVADALVHLLEDTSASGVVNLVSGREACTVDELVGMTAAAFGRSARRSSPPGSTGTGSAARRRPGRGLLPVLRHGHGLRRLARPRAARARPGIRCPHLTDYFPRLIEYAQTARWGKTPVTREEALAVAAALRDERQLRAERLAGVKSRCGRAVTRARAARLDPRDPPCFWSSEDSAPPSVPATGGPVSDRLGQRKGRWVQESVL